MTNLTPTTAPTTSSSTASGAHSTGKNTVVDSVVEKIAGIAAREVPGVHDLGSSAARAIGAIRNVINAQDKGQGVSVEVGEKQVAADIIIVAEYPVALQKVADDVRKNVSHAITALVGMEAAEINVTISDVFIPSDDNDEDESRVQ